MDTPEHRPPRFAGTGGPFLVGDLVKGHSYVPPALRKREAPEPIEGVVVQVGSGYPEGDAEEALLWVRIADCTERQCRVSEVDAGVETVPRCDICKIGRAPFLRYGTLENTGRMCSACLHRTHICALCQQPSNAPLVALAPVDQGSGPGRTASVCGACAASTARTGEGLDDVDQRP